MNFYEVAPNLDLDYLEWSTPGSWHFTSRWEYNGDNNRYFY
jgi:hypothetical protein